MPKLGLRYEASKAIGQGHLNRCLSIATAARKRGIDTLHLVNGEAATFLRQQHIGAAEILMMEETAQGHEDERFQALTHILTDICRAGNDAFVQKEIAALTGFGKRVGVIDSMPPDHFTDNPGAPPDLVITPYLDAALYRPAPPRVKSWKTGAKYLALSDSYRQIRSENTGWPDPRLLITCGGSDPAALTLKILAALDGVKTPLDVAIGQFFGSELTRQIEVESTRFNDITLHHAPDTLAPLIAGATGVIGRLGLSRYETASLGRNGLWLSAGTGYRDYLNGFATTLNHQVFFDGDPDGEARFLARVRAMKSPDRQAEFFQPNPVAYELVDGNGAEAMLSAILDLPGKAE